MKSENKNFLLNIIYQFLSLLIPLVTMPYISRVLGVDNIGIYSYTYSIVSIFMLVGMLGINNYGNRTIAMVRDDKDELSKTFLSIYYLQLILNIFVLIIYGVYLFFFCNEYRDIAVIQSILLVSICFDVNWFYFGIEKFSLSIYRNLIVKLSSLLLIFVFVKTINDLYIYTLIMAVATSFSQLSLIVLIPRYINMHKVKCREVFSHLKGVIMLFIPVLAYSVYKVMDKTMIGAFSTVTELGYYEASEKVINIPAAVIAALGTVMLPRMSYVLSKKNADYKTPLRASMKLAMKMSTIMCLGVILIADDAIVVLFGTEFEKSAKILKLLSVTIIASAWASVIRTQFLIPLKKDKIYIASTIGAALLNLVLNIMFIKRYGAMGACIGTIAAEFFVAIYQTVFTWNELDYFFYIKNMGKDALKAIVIVLIAYILSDFTTNILERIVLKIMIAIFLFIVMNVKYFVNDFCGMKKKV